MSFNIEIEGGKSVKLPTAGKYCDRNIVITATGGDGGSYDQGCADGEIAEYDRFWDNYQDNGNRTTYYYAFAGSGWTDGTFKPKYDMQPTAANYMFGLSTITDLKKTLAHCGVTLDMSLCTEFTHWFGGCTSSTLGVVDTTSASNLQYLFAQRNYLVTVDKIILREDGSQTGLSTGFTELRELVEVRFEGKFGQTVSFTRSQYLSSNSVDSIINALKDMTGQTAQKISWHTNVLLNLTDEQLAKIEAKNWTV